MTHHVFKVHQYTVTVNDFQLLAIKAIPDSGTGGIVKAMREILKQTGEIPDNALRDVYDAIKLK